MRRERANSTSLLAANGNDTFRFIRPFLRTRFLPSVGYMGNAMRCGTKSDLYSASAFTRKWTLQRNAPEEYPTVQKNVRRGRRGIYLFPHLLWTAGFTVVLYSVLIESTLQSCPLSPRRAHRHLPPPLSFGLGNVGVGAVSPKLHRPCIIHRHRNLSPLELLLLLPRAKPTSVSSSRGRLSG